MDTQVAELFLDAKKQILESSEYSTRHKVKALFNLLTSILEEVTQSDKIVFTTLYSRAAFMSNRFDLDSKLMYYLHTFRRDNERMKIGNYTEYYLDLGVYVIDELIHCLWYGKTALSPLDEKVSIFFEYQTKEVVRFRPVIEVVIDSIDTDTMEVFFYEEENASVLKKALFDQADKNESFNENIKMIHRSFAMPLHVNFVDVEVLSDDTYIPKAIVLMPDYLMDVTAVANCFKDYGSNAMLRLVSKFKHIENSIPLMVGNIANLFLDEIISLPEAKFKDLLPKIFKLDPLGISTFKDEEVRTLVEDAKKHYLNLKKAVATELPAQGIKRDRIYLEPSFYSRAYGLQGRLDLFHMGNEANHLDIVELKSGKPFRANVYGLSASHYTQTLLYDLIIKSTFGTQLKPNNYILYSKLNEKALKYAPPVKSQQYEAMRVRNELIAIEYKLAASPEDAAQLFSHLKVTHFEKVKGFELKDLENFEKAYTKWKDHEKAYFHSFCSFIAREHRMAKTGEHGISKVNGLSSLWLENIEEKEDRFGVLKALTIAQNNSQEEVPTLILHKSEDTSTLANFRKGDIAVLYPQDKNPKAVLKNQIFKCTILHIDQESIELKLRSRQYNDTLFTSVEFWNIEADTLDSGFNTLYRSLYEFCSAKQEQKDLWLGIRKPRTSTTRTYPVLDELTTEQNELLNAMTDVKDYFLLWGPPGTGKTSVMLKSLTQRIYHTTEENILLLAYTNKAVDEICAAIESIGAEFADKYIRIGSRTSCNPKYKHRVLEQLISTLGSRNEIKTLIDSKRIFVSTVSSIVSKYDLFKLKHFDRVIVDEASQILEPMLLGLLTRVGKAVLIGDHKQLPAVVTQNANQTKVSSEELRTIGIVDMGMSLFERLYHQCRRKEWSHAFGVLSYQGRMHQDIMAFANRHFYENRLAVLPGLNRLTAAQSFDTRIEQEQFVAEHRFIYVPTKTDYAFNWKTNRSEVDAVLQFTALIESLYIHNGMNFTPSTLGIITPYRAQIAMIRQAFESRLPHLLPLVTIDTVERYQGGARDIILLSLCTNRLSQLRSLVSLSQEGIDRKLNVAMTRARERLIVFGNAEILQQNETYAALIEAAAQWNLD